MTGLRHYVFLVSFYPKHELVFFLKFKKKLLCTCFASPVYDTNQYKNTDDVLERLGNIWNLGTLLHASLASPFSSYGIAEKMFTYAIAKLTESSV